MSSPNFTTKAYILHIFAVGLTNSSVWYKNERNQWQKLFQNFLYDRKIVIFGGIISSAHGSHSDPFQILFWKSRQTGYNLLKPLLRSLGLIKSQKPRFRKFRPMESKLRVGNRFKTFISIIEPWNLNSIKQAAAESAHTLQRNASIHINSPTFLHTIHLKSLQ